MEEFFQTQLQHIIDPSSTDLRELLMTEKKQRKLGMEKSKSLSNIKKPKVVSSRYSVKHLVKDLSSLKQMTDQDVANYESLIAKKAGINMLDQIPQRKQLSTAKPKKAFNFRQLQNLHYNVDYKRRLYDVEFLRSDYDNSTT